MKRLLLFLAFATAAYADRLPEWLQLPGVDEPRPTGASAWILHDATTITQERTNLVRRRYRRAQMTLSRYAVKNAVCFEQFTTGVEKLVSAKAWVCSPDGKTVREFGGAAFFTYSPTVSRWVWDQNTSAYFYAERYLEPGWIFAYEVEIQSEYALHDFRWQPGSSLPVRFESFEVVPMPGGSMKWQEFPAGFLAPVSGARGALSWHVADEAPFASNRPGAVQLNRPMVCIYLVPGEGQAPVTNTWANAAQLVRAEMEPKAAKTPAIVAETNRLAGTGNLWERIEPLCRFVQKEVVYLSVYIMTDSLAGYRPHAAADVLSNRYGDCKDKAVLLCTMLDTLGIEARVTLVNSGAPRRNRLEWPSIQFNHAVVAIRATEPIPAGWTTVKSAGADWVLFDPTNDEIPLGLFPTYDTGGLALVLAPGVDAPVTLPAVAAPSAEQSITIDLQLAEDGTAKVSAEEERSGLAAADAINREETVPLGERWGAFERRITRRLPLATGLTWNTTKDTKAHRWTSSAKFTAPAAGKRIARSTQSISTDLLSAVPELEPWEDGSPGWFNLAPSSTVRKVRLTPPAGWEFVDLPADWSTLSASGDGTMTYRRDGDTLVGEVHLRVAGGVLDRDAYLGVRELLHATLAAERRPVILKRPAPAVPAAKT